MPLTPFLRALFLLLLSSSISCFPSKWKNCSSVNRCGKFNFSYPFGKRYSGCGDLDFQLECDPTDNHPLLKIRENEYHILEPYILGNNSINHRIKIVSDNLWRDKCRLLDNYTQSWWYNYIFFQIAPGYTNLTFWRDCSFGKNYTSSKLEMCGNAWYYSFGSEIDFNRKHFCQTHLQLPIKKEVLQFNKSINNHTFLEQGFEIKWRVDPYRDQVCGACLMTKGTCGYNKSTKFLCYCPDGTSYLDRCPGGGNKSAIVRGYRKKLAIVIGCFIGGAVLTALSVILFLKFYVKKRRSLSSGFASGFSKHQRKDMEASGLSKLKIDNLPIFSSEELRRATNCFHEENEVGDGGFGSVYLGKLEDGRSVAVKRLYQDNARRVEQFINEVKLFSTLNHPGVVRLYGCAYDDSPELLLVYEFVPNGTLADHLHGHRRDPKGLPWDTRLSIAIQTAQALAFLHSLDPPIFHRDVKSSNILLDEDFNVKVADFGLCRIIPDNASHVTTGPQGTPGYVDPEYHWSYQLTEKSDVYSFGVVLVEIISGKLAVDINRNGREINLSNLAITKIQEGALHELVDQKLEIEMNQKVKVMVSAAAELAFKCLVLESVNRPRMTEVVAQLEQIRQSWATSTCASEQWRSIPNIKQPTTEPSISSTPISVQNKWPSISSAPNNSA